jgi:hypothetical protein
MKRFLILNCLSAVLCALPVYVLAQAIAPVGMVVDLRGPVSATDQGKSARLEVMSYLRPQMEIELGAGAMMAVTWYANSSENRFSGPARLKVLPDKIQVLQGASGEERSLGEARVSAAKRVASTRLAQAAIMMRGMNPGTDAAALVPARGSRTMILNPVFRWPVQAAGAPLRFELRRASGELLYQAAASGDTLQLPAGNALDWGQRYRWNVRAERASSGPVEGEFEVITREQLLDLAARRPPNDGPFSDWVLFAAALDDLALYADAKEVWQWLAAQRPDDENLKRLANR